MRQLTPPVPVFQAVQGCEVVGLIDPEDAEESERRDSMQAHASLVGAVLPHVRPPGGRPRSGERQALQERPAPR